VSQKAKSLAISEEGREGVRFPKKGRDVGRIGPYLQEGGEIYTSDKKKHRGESKRNVSLKNSDKLCGA